MPRQRVYHTPQEEEHSAIISQLTRSLISQSTEARKEAKRQRRLGRDPCDIISQADVVASRYMQRIIEYRVSHGIEMYPRCLITPAG
jgi:hypothetical protein